jgi:hypothetical protein
MMVVVSRGVYDALSPVYHELPRHMMMTPDDDDDDDTCLSSAAKTHDDDT